MYITTENIEEQICLGCTNDFVSFFVKKGAVFIRATPFVFYPRLLRDKVENIGVLFGKYFLFTQIRHPYTSR